MIPERYKNCSLTQFDSNLIKPVLDWVDLPNKEFLFIHGTSGCGKTHLTCGICNDLTKNNVSVGYVSFPDVVLELRSTMNINSEDTETNIIKKYRKNKIGIFDDLAANKPSEYVIECLYAIINHRYEGCIPTIVSSNLSISDISKIYGDRIASRLASGVVFKLTGNDRRISKQG